MNQAANVTNAAHVAHIVIVEDDDKIAALLADYCAAAGYRTTQIGDDTFAEPGHKRIARVSRGGENDDRGDAEGEQVGHVDFRNVAGDAPGAGHSEDDTRREADARDGEALQQNVVHDVAG